MSNELIKLGDLSGLSKPATKLIEKVCGAIGTVYEPTKIKRLAKANVEAKKIAALGQIAVSEIEMRAAQRLLATETHNQVNIDTILEMSTQSLHDDSKPEEIEDDWIASFFENAKSCSNEEMQKIWASILAGQANTPGSFSKRTLNLVASLEQKDAEVFRLLIDFMIFFNGHPIVLVTKTNEDPYKNHGLLFTHLKHLDYLGLIDFESIAGYTYSDQPKQATVKYGNTTLEIEFPDDTKNILNVGHVILTQAGLELAAITGQRIVEGFVQHIQDYFIENGIKVISNSQSGEIHGKTS